METINWNISNIHCDGSSARLQKVLSGKTGVQSAEVSFAYEQAQLKFDSTLISADKIQVVVEKAGFEIAASKINGVMSYLGLCFEKTDNG